jgi:hypothetical protein
VTVLQGEDTVHEAGELQVVGGDQRCGSLHPRHFADVLEHLVGGVGIEVARGLVGQDQAGPIRQGASEGHPLLLAARHLRRLVMQPLGQAQPLQQDPGAVARNLEAGARDPQRQPDVI